MTASQILTIVGYVGFGGLLKSLLDFFIGSRGTKQNARLTFKEIRYKAIILLCYALVNYEREKTYLLLNRPDINSYEKLVNELHAEFINMSLYGSDKVMLALKEFIDIPSKETLNALAISMRKDLYGISTKLKHTNLQLNAL
jgi:hypothetical protein